MVWVSEEMEPKRRSSCSSKSAINSSGTGWPSLNLSGSRISKRRKDLLIRSRTFRGEGNPFHGEWTKSAFRHEHLAPSPTLERKAPSKPTQGPPLRILVAEMNDDHRLYFSVLPSRRQRRPGP